MTFVATTHPFWLALLLGCFQLIDPIMEGVYDDNVDWFTVTDYLPDPFLSDQSLPRQPLPLSWLKVGAHVP